MFDASQQQIMDVDNIIMDPNLDYRLYKPYWHQDWKSVFEGITLEMHLVHHCNLNCAGCNHFACIAEPWYITKEDFKNQLQIAHERLPTIKRLLLLGGEPTLHPDLLELCKIAKTIFKNDAQIFVLTNAIKAKVIQEHEDEYRKIGITFTVCAYPGHGDLKTCKELFNSKNPIATGINTRMYMDQTKVDDNGTQDKDSTFYYCNRYALPCIQLKDYKIYLCPFAAYLDAYRKKYNIDIPETEEDYLDLRTVNTEKLHKFIFKSKPICKYCDQSDIAVWPWHQSQFTKDEWNIPYKELYFQDYNAFEKIQNNEEYFTNAINQEYNPCHIELAYQFDSQQKNFTKYGYGKIDIIIPYYMMQPYQIVELYQSLLSQTIIHQCHIYLISDASYDDRALFEQFWDTGLPCTFLRLEKRSGPGAARNLGLSYARNKYVLFLDADDILTNHYALEEAYNEAEKKQYDLTSFYLKKDFRKGPRHLDANGKEVFLINRQFLIDNDIKFYPFYFCEDGIFYQDCKLKTRNISNTFSTIPFGIYRTKNNYSNITTIGEGKETLIVHIICFFIMYLHHMKASTTESTKRSNTDSVCFQLDRIVEELINICAFPQEQYLVEGVLVLFYYLTYLIYKNYHYIPKGENKLLNDTKQLWVKQFIKNDISIQTSNGELNTIDDVIQFIKHSFGMMTQTLYSQNMLEYLFKEIMEYNNEFKITST